MPNLDDLLTERPTGDVCHDYCLQTNCDSYTLHQSMCMVTFDFNSDTYMVIDYQDRDTFCYVRGDPNVPPVDCRSTSNCTPQLSSCGGSLPDRNFSKADLLSCISNVSSLSFESKTFARKTHASNDFFYNEADKTFMNG